MKTYGLIGKNIGYSFSRNYFNKKFNTANISKSQYINFDLDTLNELNKIFYINIYGLNVTIPYKEDIIPYLDSLDYHAEKIGAVNTIKLENEKKIGYNTDWIGFKKSIEPLIKPHHKQALILGTGGASKAIKYALNQLKIKYHVVSRTEGDYSYNDLNDQVLNNHQIIINCTPVGTYPNVNQAPEINYNLIKSTHLAYDLIYNPAETLFLKNCKAKGATAKNGLEMLEIQAEEAWKIWNL